MDRGRHRSNSVERRRDSTLEKRKHHPSRSRSTERKRSHRSRTRSHSRSRSRSRSRDRKGRRHEKRHPRSRSRSRSIEKKSNSYSYSRPRPRSRSQSLERRRQRGKRHSSRSPSPSPVKKSKTASMLLEKNSVATESLSHLPEALIEDENMIAQFMGFSGFDSTKGKKVPGADVSAVDIKKTRQYRQYMNRKGGFNRPLENK